MKSLFLTWLFALSFGSASCFAGISDSLYTITKGGISWTEDAVFGNSIKYDESNLPNTTDRMDGTIYYVKAGKSNLNEDGLSWATAFSDLQQALDLADSNDQVWVAEGVYTPHSVPFSRETSFMLPPGVQLYGGFLGSEQSLDQRAGSFELTVLSGEVQNDGNPTNNIKAVVFFDSNLSSSSTPYAVIDGFSIRDGYNELGSGAGLSVHDSDLSIVRGAKIHLNNLNFENNTALVGGALQLFYHSGNISNSNFINNSALNSGGAIAFNIYWGVDRYISNCVFIGNSAGVHGGAISRVGGSSSNINHWLINSIFISNTAGQRGGAVSYSSHGTDNRPGRPWSLGNIVFANNQAPNGSALWIAPGATVSSSGGSAYIAPSRIKANNITVSRNIGKNAIHISEHSSRPSLDASLTLRNSIVWNNGNESVAGPLDIAVSIIDSQNYAGDFVIYSDPRFISPEHLNFRLQRSSPGIQLGYWGFLPRDIVDFDEDGDISEFLPSDVDGRFRLTTADSLYQRVELGAYASNRLSAAQRQVLPKP